jgi:hypothetical protein
MVRLAALLSSFALACGTPPTIIDARMDAAAPDAGAQDAGLGDAGMIGSDAGMMDGGCEPPAPAVWDPVDTGGPEGETLSDCIARVGALTDDRVPEDQAYELTTFGGPGDEQPVACSGAPIADGSWYYAANEQRFSCGTRVRLVDAARARCVIVEVADVGPNACVEEAGGMPLWDVSPLAAQQLFDVSSVGYSEHRAVFGAPVASDNALGPCDATIADPRTFTRGFIGGPCDSPGDCAYAGGICLTPAMGWPGGTCSLACETSCPDRAGANAFTACADVGGALSCVARCDFTLFPTGCRSGYACEPRPHPTTGALRNVCVPLEC